jgi:hypothetical protein
MKNQEFDNLTVAEKCWSIWTATCEGRDVDFTWDELKALQDAGFIENLRFERPYIGSRKGKTERWSFEWTDRLKALAEALGKFRRARQPSDFGPVCKHGIAEGHCPECGDEPATQKGAGL